MSGRLIAVCVGRISTDHGKRTAIVKTPVSGRVEVRELGLEGDQQADRRYHGGPDKAVYAYGTEHYPYWREQLGRELPWGQFGENLCLEGFPDAEILLGDRIAVGETEFEVTEPRIPCSKLAWRMDDPAFVKKFADSLRIGFYLRVLRPGSIGAGDPARLMARGAGPSLLDEFQRRMRPRK